MVTESDVYCSELLCSLEFSAVVSDVWLGAGDEFTSGAVCLPQYECEHLCKLMGDACHSVNMHKTLPRCFINHEACDSEITLPNEYFGLDMDYSLLVKRESSKPR